MKEYSLALKTDLFFLKTHGQLESFDDYLVIKNPINKNLFWENLIYFFDAPKSDSLSIWKKIFQDQFFKMDLEHITFIWDSQLINEGYLAAFLADGFEPLISMVMVCNKMIKPLVLSQNILIRPIESELDWQMVLKNQVLCRKDYYLESAYRQFMLNKIKNFRLMIDQGKGFWMGAFLENQLVGDLGLFYESGIGRFQSIETHPHFRKMGICSNLIFNTKNFAQENNLAQTFVIFADPDYHALKIYQSLGFVAEGKQIGMCKYKKEKWAI